MIEREFPRTKGRYVYGLVDPTTRQIRYVGKTKGYLNSRLKGHLREAQVSSQHNHRLAWMRMLFKKNLVPSLIMLEEVVTADGLVKAERWWIQELRSRGLDLVNGTDGGEGMENPSPATRLKLQARPQVGFSVEVRRKGNEALRRKWATDSEYRALMKEINKSRRDPTKRYSKYRSRTKKGTQEWRDAISRSRVGRPKSEEHKAKLSQAARNQFATKGHPMKGKHLSDNHRANLRAAWVRRKMKAKSK